MSQACPWLCEHIEITINIQPYPRKLLVASYCLLMIFFHRNRSVAFVSVVYYYSYTEIKLEKDLPGFFHKGFAYFSLKYGPILMTA